MTRVCAMICEIIIELALQFTRTSHTPTFHPLFTIDCHCVSAITFNSTRSLSLTFTPHFSQTSSCSGWLCTPDNT